MASLTCSASLPASKVNADFFVSLMLFFTILFFSYLPEDMAGGILSDLRVLQAPGIGESTQRINSLRLKTARTGAVCRTSSESCTNVAGWVAGRTQREERFIRTKSLIRCPKCWNPGFVILAGYLDLAPGYLMSTIIGGHFFRSHRTHPIPI